MTWYPIAFLPPQYQDASGDNYSGAVLKAYEAGTTTPINMATTYEGTTTASSFVLNASGYPVSGGAVIIPHVQEDYKLALYPNQASADANSGATWTYDDIKIAEVANEAFVQSFSGDGSTTSFTLSENLGDNEDTVMIFADKKFGEYTTNGTFDSDSDWTKGTGWTIGSGVATASGAISTDLTQSAALPLIEGHSYTITYTVTRSAGGVKPKIGGTSGTERTAAGTYTETIIAGSTQALTFSGNAFTGTVDTVSIHRTTASRREILRPDEFTLDGVDLDFDEAPASGTSNIIVFAPSLLFGAVNSLVDAAATSETNAAASAAAALVSEGNASDSEDAALVSEGNAAASETAAGVSETNAAASETAAGVSETNAAASETAAGVSETNAATSETNAGNSETAAAASAAAAQVAKIEWQGTYNAGTAYALNDAVVFNGSSFINIQAGTGQTPVVGGTAYWDDLAVKGADGIGSGDLLAANNLSDLGNTTTAKTNLGLGTGDSPQFTAVNIGHASDTTITRVSAGLAAIEGSNILLASGLGSITQAYDANTAKLNGGSNVWTQTNTFANIIVDQFRSSTSNIATTGSVRLAKTNSVAWRNNANSANVQMSLSGTDQFAFDSGIDVTGNIAVSGTVDGRDIAADGATLDALIITGWTSYTPAWTSSGTDPSLGNGTITGYWRRVGANAEVIIKIQFGSTTTYGTGTYSFSLPSGVTVNNTIVGLLTPIGAVGANDAGTANYTGTPIMDTTSAARITQHPSGAYWTNTVPWTKAVNDTIEFSLNFPATFS